MTSRFRRHILRFQLPPDNSDPTQPAPTSRTVSSRARFEFDALNDKIVSMFSQFRQFGKAVAAHSGKVVGTSVLALGSAILAIINAWRGGISPTSLYLSLAAGLLLLYAFFGAWCDENKAKIAIGDKLRKIESGMPLISCTGAEVVNLVPRKVAGAPRYGNATTTYFAVAHFANDPEIRSELSVAQNLAAKIEGYRLDGSFITSIQGSWCTRLPDDFTFSQTSPTFQIDLPPSDLPVSLYLAIVGESMDHDVEDGFYLYNQVLGDQLWRQSPLALPDKCSLRVALKGVRVECSFDFTLEYQSLKAMTQELNDTGLVPKRWDTPLKISVRA